MEDKLRDGRSGLVIACPAVQIFQGLPPLSRLSPRRGRRLPALWLTLLALLLFPQAAAQASDPPETISESGLQTQVWPQSRRKYTEQEIEQLIRESARRYGLPETKVVRIARCESKLDPNVISKNRRFWGLYQFDLKTWNNTPEGKAKLDRRDPVANINAAHRHMKAHGFGAWPHCKSR